jgi:DNA processing protein
VFTPTPRILPRSVLADTRGRLHDRVRFSGLWAAGEISGLALTTIAIVGSRAPSDAGRRLAFETARTLARSGVCILSGLALGIDGAAHSGALNAGCPTIGVLGGGHNCFHPKRNRPLAERMIASGGAVLSPYAPDEPAYPSQFLQRNGVVAALADAIVIVEAASRSGALNTASWASDLGVPVFAFPGDVDRPKVAGCLALLRDGATLVRSADDILGDLGLAKPSAEQSSDHAIRTPMDNSVANDPVHRELLTLLRGGETGLETLLERSGLAPTDLIAKLSTLEVDGLVERRPGQRYALT